MIQDSSGKTGLCSLALPLFVVRKPLRQTTSDSCVAGYSCSDNSLSPKGYPCPIGTFSLAGAKACTPCLGKRL
jgi:hypothetical protein